MVSAVYVQTSIKGNIDLSTDSGAYYREYWTDAHEINPKSEVIRREIIDRFFPGSLVGKRILEIGVGGEGGLISCLAKDNDVHGVDISDAAARNCSRMGLPFTVANLDTDKLGFADGSYDVVFALEVFEHFANPQFALEELRRVLKDDGQLLISAPTPWCYHYPRLFYPALFRDDNFTEFLMINGFKPQKTDSWFIPIRHNQELDVPPAMKIWNSFWMSTKVSSSDAKGYFELGAYFWNKINAYGLRESPLEALDLFRKSCLADSNDEASLCFTHALLYRYIYGDVEEFSARFIDLFSRLCGINTSDMGLNEIFFIKIVLEARKFGICLVEDNLFDKLLEVALLHQELKRFMDSICCKDAASFGEKYA